MGGKASLADESRSMGRTHAYWRVYWAGAAIALELDVDLRRESGGRVSLDDVLRAYDRRRAASPKEMTAAEAVRIADAVAGRPMRVPETRILGHLRGIFPNLPADFPVLAKIRSPF